MATITMTRTTGGGMLGLQIPSTARRVGRVGPGKTVSHEVGPGRHEVKVKRAWAHVEAEVEAAEDGEVRLFCSEQEAFTPETAVVALARRGGLRIWREEDGPAV